MASRRDGLPSMTSLRSSAEVHQPLPFASLTRLLRRPGFWLILVVLVLITVPHYREELTTPRFLTDWLTSFGLGRHSFERILYLVPIIWSAFLFGRRAAFMVSLFTLACMVPRAVFISDKPIDSLFETAAVFVLGNVVAISSDALRKERERRARLEMAESTLQMQIAVIKENEKRLTALNRTSDILSQSLDPSETLTKAIENVIELMEVEAALLYLLDQEQDSLSLATSSGVPVGDGGCMARVKLGQGLNGTVASTGEAKFVGNTLEGALSQEIGQGFRSAYVVPMKSKGQVMGTLCVMVKAYRWFRQDEIELLTAIANQIGVAVENAALYHKEKQAMEWFAASESKYRGLFENANDAIWVHDLDGYITVVNKACVRQTGYSMDELINMNVKQFLPGESLALAMQVRRKLFNNEAIEQPYEQRIIRKDGSEAQLKLTTSLVLDGGTVTGFQNISRDVTEEQRMRENLRFYLEEVTKAQEVERLRIARELHDDTIQQLVALSRQLDMLSDDRTLPPEQKESVERLWKHANSIIQGVRRLSQDLRPPTLDRLGLLPALQWLVSELSKYSSIPIEIRVRGVERRLPADVELMLFRIAQEALRNVCRHSGATSAEVALDFDSGKTRIKVSDNGKGFDVPGSMGDLTRLGKLGLAGMDERAKLVGGWLEMRSEPGKGTTVSVEVPL